MQSQNNRFSRLDLIQQSQSFRSFFASHHRVFRSAGVLIFQDRLKHLVFVNFFAAVALSGRA